MTAHELCRLLEAWSPLERENRSDGPVFGDFDREVRTVAVSLLATPRILRTAKEIGADMLLVHEPTFFTGPVVPEGDPVTEQKRALVEELDIPLYRFHDHAHFTALDKINQGVMAALGLAGEFDGQKTFTLKEPCPIGRLKEQIAERLGLSHLRYMGAEELTVRRMALLFGAWGERTIYEHLHREGIDLVLAGEATEWSLCEYVRDAGELGFPLGLLLLGHMGSEKSGMTTVVDYINREVSGVRAVYLDCGETFVL